MTYSKLYTAMFVLISVVGCNSSNDIKEEPSVIEKVGFEASCITIECEQNNKEVVSQIYNEVINNKNSQITYSVFSENFMQHRTGKSTEVSAQETYYNELLTTNPDHTAAVKHIVADGQYVAVHWHYSQNSENEFSGQEIVDLYKLESGKVIEQWNKIETVSDSSASGNSVFSDLYVYQGDKPSISDSELELNKTRVTEFYIELFSTGNVALVDEQVDPSYLQHNIWVPNGSQALKDFVTYLKGENKLSDVTIERTLAEGDIVWTFMIKDNLSLVDLWRVEQSSQKIVEHWDI
ncbi:nuclear transport factor 2 family protein [Pseudoalteromonas denitrificans]|uniref:Predicted SnoaL-like aldol condensation-catalyzing enzyme n=1 Tax=Pseudoalteromonas denitrificans DSM 6059 TaxID=1123010 RepID=A0A1I1URJ4_9GAMM|nr:ester cyclase [Pseudoalteromonas denitrificans]SFD73205.1 Predicted SnoaL-like aldol condensation-catalyzing enzyme [Pseudoalteromonas denitrificans DSM 6059]